MEVEAPLILVLEEVEDPHHGFFVGQVAGSKGGAVVQMLIPKHHTRLHLYPAGVEVYIIH